MVTESNLVGRLMPAVARRAMITHRTPTSQLVFEAKTRTSAAFDNALAAVERWAVIRDIKPRHDLLEAAPGFGSRAPNFEVVMPPKPEIANVLMMENGSTPPAVADPAAPGTGTGNRSGQTVFMKRKTGLTQNRIINWGMKAAGAALTLYALPFAPITAAGFYTFTLPLTAVGLGLIYASLGQRNRDKIASFIRDIRQGNAAIPKPIRYALYGLEGLGVLSSLKAPLGFVMLLAAGLGHAVVFKIAKAKKSLDNAPLDQKLAQADLPTLIGLVDSMTPQSLPRDRDSLELVSLELRKQIVHLRRVPADTEALQTRIGQILDHIDLELAPSPAAPES